MARLRERVTELSRRLRDWVARLSTAWLVVLALAVLSAASGAGVFMYQTYAFVEHDNQFCLSCHLMVDPYERFAQSAHRGLGCKACHQPTFVERSRMAVSQILENPEEITTHAHVPNSACASCHIEGNPEQWRTISQSIGHRVHLESDDPSLRGLMCVECHSTSIHEFAPSDRTCGQSGCHEDTRIVLGRMQPLTIHCVGCHDFSRPVADIETVGVGRAQMQPGRNECLTCHQMRVLVADMPPDEPHDRVCGACHNPHDQLTPREAERTCASAGCHVRPDTLTTMHQGLAVGVLENCLACHPAHQFRVQGDRCLDCHQDIYDDAPRPLGQISRSAVQAPSSMGGVSGLLGALAARFTGTAQTPAQAPAQTPRRPAQAPARELRGTPAPAQEFQQAPSRPLIFAHRPHRGVACTECHSTAVTHGAVTVTSVRQCRECHHTSPVADQCSRCHQPAQLRTERYPIRQTVQLSVVPQPRTRELPFSHAVHEREACGSCHRQPLTMAVTVSCNSCHEQHHRPTTQCMSCHVRPPGDAHTVNAHLGCTGAGCHDPVPAQVRNVPRTRPFCLSCHQDLVQHEPGGNCADCHRLPAPRPQAALPGTELRAGGGR
jgi:hypothetical protein